MNNKYSPMTSFFIYAAGADKDFLALCPKKEVIKFVGMGILVCFTSLFAILSLTYAFHSLFNPVPLGGDEHWKLNEWDLALSIFLGLLWGAFIFFVDRFFISTMSKNAPIGMQILTSLPRFAIAVLISLTISKPVEIIFFKDRLKNEIEKNKEAELKYFVKKEQDKIDTLDKTITYNKQQLDNLKVQSVFKDEISVIDDSYLRSQKSIKETEIEKLETIITKDYYQQQRYEVLKNEIKDLEKRIIAVRNNNSRLRTQEQQDAQMKSNELINNRLGIENSIIRDSLQKEKYLTDISQKKDSLNSSISSSFSNNLCTQLEALNTLTSGKNIDPTSSTYKYEIKNAEGFRKYSLVIWLIFLAIEITPILMKLTLPRGEYDEITKAHFESIKGQNQAYKMYRQNIYSKYFTISEEQEKNLISHFYDGIKQNREISLQNEIMVWDHKKTPYSEFKNLVFFYLFDNILSSGKTRKLKILEQTVGPQPIPSEFQELPVRNRINIFNYKEWKLYVFCVKLIKAIKDKSVDKTSDMFYKALFGIVGIGIPLTVASFLLPPRFYVAVEKVFEYIQNA